MNLRKPLRTFTRAVARASRFLLVYLLCVCMVLLPVPLARADFPDADGNFTLWIEAGRAAHTFEIWDPAYYAPYFSGGGSLVQPGGTRITGTLPTGTPSLVVRDTTSGEFAPLPADANGVANVSAAAWASESGNPVHTLYFLVGYERMGHSLIVSQPNGSYYVANSGTQWIQGSQEYLVDYSAPYDPALPYRVLDLTAWQQSEENATDTTLSAWAEINPAPPLASVTIAVDAIEEGHWFTIHAQHPGGPEMLQRVQAVRGSFGADLSLDQNATILTATVGLGMNISIERDADHFSVGVPASIVGGSYQSFPLYGSFPAVPDRGHPLVPQQISIVDELITGADASFTLWFADGYRTDFSLTNPGYNSANELRTWTTTPLRDDSGAALAPMDGDGNPTTHAVYQITLDVDPQQSWWLVNNTTGEQYPIGKTELLGAYENYHVNLPPSDWSTLTLSLHSSQKDSQLELGFMYPSGSWAYVIVPAISSDDHDARIYANFPGSNSDFYNYPLSPPSWAALLLYNFDTYESYELTGFTLTLPNPRPYEWPYGAMIWGGTTQTVNSFSPAAQNDLLDWQAPPTPTTFSISSSRWGHELVIRRADGRHDYPIQAHAIEGDYFLGGANSYYYFTATGLTATEPQWRVFDKTTGEQAGDYQTDLIEWFSVQPPVNEAAGDSGFESVYLSWRYPVGQVASVSIERKSDVANAIWKEVAGFPVDTTSLDPSLVYWWEDTSLVRSGTYSYRFRAHFSNSTSPSSIETSASVTFADSDGDGMSDKWEQLWKLNPYDASDATARIHGIGLSALQMHSLAMSPGGGGGAGRGIDPGLDLDLDLQDDEAPRPDDWKKPRATLWQSAEYDGTSRTETHDIFTWELPEGVTGSVQIEREVEEGQWEVVHTAAASGQYARVKAYPRDWLAWEQNRADPATDAYVKKMWKRLVPAWNEAFNHRLKGVCSSNESVCKVRLRRLHSTIWRENPGIPEFSMEGVVQTPDTARLFYKHVKYEATVTKRLYGGGTEERTDTETATFDPMGKENYTWPVNVPPPGYPRIGSLSADATDSVLCSVWDCPWPNNYYRGVYTNSEATPAIRVVTPSSLPDFGGSVVSRDSFPQESTNTPQYYTKTYTTWSGSESTQYNYKSTLSGEYSRASFFSAVYSQMPALPQVQPEDVYSLPQVQPGDDYYVNMPLLNGSPRVMSARETFPQPRSGAGNSFTDFLTTSVSERVYYPYRGLLSLSKSTYWLECNDCLPSAAIVISEWSRNLSLTGNRQASPVSRSFVKSISIHPGSNPGRQTRSREIITSDVTGSGINEDRVLEADVVPVETEGLGRIASVSIGLGGDGGFQTAEELSIKIISQTVRVDGPPETEVILPYSELPGLYINEGQDDINSDREELGATNSRSKATEQPFLISKDWAGIRIFVVMPKGHTVLRVYIRGANGEELKIKHQNMPSVEVDSFLDDVETAFGLSEQNLETGGIARLVGARHTKENFVTRVAHSLWDWIRGPVRSVVGKSFDATAAAIIIPVTQAKGAFGGIASGISGDLKMAKDLVGVLTFQISVPAAIKSTFAELRAAINRVGYWGLLEAIANDFVAKAEKGVDGQPLKSYGPNGEKTLGFDPAFLHANYMVGYFAGYGAEQVAALVALSAVGGAAIKFGPAVATSLSKWAQGEKWVKTFGTLASFAREAKTSALGYILFYVQDPRLRGVMLSALEALDTGRAVASTLTKALDRPLGVLGRVITKIDDKNPGRIGMQKLFEKLGTRIDGPRKGQALLNTWALEQDAVALQRYIKRAAQNAEKLEVYGEHTADAMLGFTTHYNRFETPDRPGHFNADGLVGRVEDYHFLLKTDTPAGAKCARLTQEAAINAPVYLDGRPKILVKKLEDVYPVLYHHCSEVALPQKLRRTADGKVVLMPHPTERGIM